MMKKGMVVFLLLISSLFLVACDDLNEYYIVTFESNGGTEVLEQEVLKNNKAIKPDNPTREDGLVFQYWTLDGEKYTFDELVESDITLVAVWGEGHYENPIWEPILADPSVIYWDGIYYAYGTQDEGYWSGDFGVKYGPILSSTDLVEWTYEDSLFRGATRPLWGTANAGIWAPDAVIINDKVLVYYSLSTWGDPDPGIGVMSADHPLGPWTDHGKVFTSNEIGVNNSIDASVFSDPEGNVYMIWGSFRGLYGIELTSDGLSVKNGVEYAKENKVHIAGLDTSTPWNGRTYEAPYIIYKDNWYYMFVSSGTCCEGLNSTYNVRVSRSRDPLGPYFDHNGMTMLNTDRGYQVLIGSERFVGVGHNGIIQDKAGDYYIVYHGFDTKEPSHIGNSNRRAMLMDLLVWDKDGWPSVEGLIPSETSPIPTT